MPKYTLRSRRPAHAVVRDPSADGRAAPVPATPAPPDRAAAGCRVESLEVRTLFAVAPVAVAPAVVAPAAAAGANVRFGSYASRTVGSDPSGYQPLAAAALPAKPDGLTATAAGNQIGLAWQPVAGAGSYVVYRVAVAGELPAGPLVRLKSGLTTTAYQDLGEAGTEYLYVVTAAARGGEGRPSAAAVVRTPGGVGTPPVSPPPASPPVLPPPVVTPPPTPGPPTEGMPTFTPSGLSVAVSGGKARLPNGSTLSFAGRTLDFAAPEVRSNTLTPAAPVNYTTRLGSDTQSWFAALPLVPAEAQPFRGGLWHGVIPSSVVVRSADGSRTFVAGTDYRLNTEWGQVANIDNRLGAPDTGRLSVSYRYVTQRLDLIQLLPNGQLAVKQGASAIVAPELPAADPGAVALAGVYVYTMDGARESNFAIRPADVLPINPAAPVAPINNAAIARTLSKLRSGQPVNIALHGDSITAGAEVRIVNGDRSLTYTGRLMAELRRRFPGTPITETLAAMGGISAEFNGDVFRNKVLAPHDAGRKVDLVVIALGMNDPAKPVDNMKRPLTEMIRQAKARGMEVLLVTTMPFSPATERKYTGTPKAQIAQATREVGAAENVAVADVYAEWMNLPTRGIPAHVPVHNWATHPGEFGMRIYSDVILRHFVP